MEADLDAEIVYTQKLLSSVKDDIDACASVRIKKLYNEVQELLDSGEIRKIRSKNDRMQALDIKRRQVASLDTRPIWR